MAHDAQDFAGILDNLTLRCSIALPIVGRVGRNMGGLDSPCHGNELEQQTPTDRTQVVLLGRYFLGGNVSFASSNYEVMEYDTRSGVSPAPCASDISDYISDYCP